MNLSENISVREIRKLRSHHWLSPIWQSITPRHSRIYGRYQAARIFVDFGAAFCFVAGSLLFLNATQGVAAAVLFLVGSLLFSVKPTIDLIRAFHLKKILSER